MRSETGCLEEVHPFHTLFDLVAQHGWGFVMAELAEVALVRGENSVAMVMAVVAEGIASGNVSRYAPDLAPGVPPPVLTADADHPRLRSSVVHPIDHPTSLVKTRHAKREQE
jgi:hypothetical protein